jgi:hypothetical protein
MIAAIYGCKRQGGNRRMTPDEAIRLHREMEAFLARSPGSLDDRDRHQLTQIRFAFRTDVTDAYLREKVGDACACLDRWLSPRKWRGRDSTIVQHHARTAIHKVRMAVDRAFPEAPGS